MLSGLAAVSSSPPSLSSHCERFPRFPLPAPPPCAQREREQPSAGQASRAPGLEVSQHGTREHETVIALA